MPRHSFRRFALPGRAVQFAVILILTVIGDHSAAFAQADCEVAQSTFDMDAQLVGQYAPTHLRLMGSRYVDLRRAARGLACSGVPLVAFDGLRYLPVARYDDPGLYFFVPQLARVFVISLVTATDVFLIGFVLLASAFGILGFLRMAETKLGRGIGIIAFLLLTIVELIPGDVYVINAAPAIACVPWILSFVSRRKLTVGMLIALGLTGVISQTANFMRSHSGTGIVLFAFVVVVGAYQARPVGRILLVVTLLLGMAAATLVVRHVYGQRDAFLQRQPGAAMELARGHVFWHSVYIGLSWVKNVDVPAYKDEVAFAKVHELHPEMGIYSPEYEQVLKEEIFKLIKRRPFLILANLFTKLVVVAFFCACAANVGLYAARLARKPIPLDAAFWFATAFCALPAVLVVPNPKYFLGSIAFAAIFAAHSAEYAARNPQLYGRLEWIRRIVFAERRKAA